MRTTVSAHTSSILLILAAAVATLALPTLAPAQQAKLKVAAVYTVPFEQQWVGRIHKALQAGEARGEIEYKATENVANADYERVLRQRAVLLEFKVTTPDGAVRRWGTATVPLDEAGMPLSGPVLDLDATLYTNDDVTRMVIRDGDTTVPATDYAIERTGSFYKRRLRQRTSSARW